MQVSPDLPRESHKSYTVQTYSISRCVMTLARHQCPEGLKVASIVDERSNLHKNLIDDLKNLHQTWVDIFSKVHK
jgi:uncharacterized protein (DUF302 family)